MSKLKNKENKNKTEIKNCYTKKGSDSTYALSLYRLLHSTHHHIFFYFCMGSSTIPQSPNLCSVPNQSTTTLPFTPHPPPLLFLFRILAFNRRTITTIPSASTLAARDSCAHLQHCRRRHRLRHTHKCMYVCVKEREREVVVVAYLLRLMKSFMKRMSALNASSDTPL